MSALKNLLTENQLNCKEEYYLHDTLPLDEETKSNTEIHHNKYFELSDYDMKVTKDVEFLFQEEKDNIHYNKNYEDDYYFGQMKHQSSKEEIKQIIDSNYKYRIPLMLLTFIPLLRIFFTVSKMDEAFEDKEIKEVILKFVALFLFILNLFIYLLTFDPYWKIFFIFINNLYLIGIVAILVMKRRKTVMINELYN